MNQIELSCQDIDQPEWFNRVEPLCQQILTAVNINSWELSLVLCNNQFIQNLNRDYRGKDYPTDVLSFPQDDLPLEKGLQELHYAGDIIISLEMIQNNADAFNVTFSEEFVRMLIHGILHLNGMDHQTNDSQEEMLLLQEQILTQFKGVDLL